MTIRGEQRMGFFPKADAAVLQSKHEPERIRPQTVGPVFDTEHAGQPIDPWSPAAARECYPLPVEDGAPATIPDEPSCLSDRYLYPLLTQNERLRLTMLWYYTRDTLGDAELLSRLQEKAFLAQESIGWEFAIIGLLGINTYTRLATFGLPLAILPRRESTCAHTVNQPLTNVFLLPNMAEDWRFRESPHVEIGGLRSYAGAPLRLETEFGEGIALGSLCVASNSAHGALTKEQQVTLTRLADWAVSDIIHCARARRLRERRRMAELISKAQYKAEVESSEEAVMEILRAVYPKALIEVQSSKASQIGIARRGPISAHELEGGLWEDVDYIDDFIENYNHQEPPVDRVIRLIAAQCDAPSGPSFLVVASNELQLVFDDVDSWFVQTCAAMLTKVWHKRLLREAVTAKETFLRSVTHQLRTPIHGIMGSIELLSEELKTQNVPQNSELGATILSKDDVQSKIRRTGGGFATKVADPLIYIQTIQTAAQDLISIVNSIITLNRWADIAMAERSDALHSIYELQEGISNELSKAMYGNTRYTATTFFVHDFASSYNIFIDSNLLRDTLLPLILNAMQNTPGGVINITASVRQSSRELVVDIEDTGCGIHPEDQQRIFEAFEKVDVHSIGAGLGLTLASKFATLLGGSVTLMSSVLKKGSHFRALFRDVTFACPRTPPQPSTDKLKSLPSTFYKIASGSGGSPLSDYFSTFLTYQGFAPSRDLHDSLVIFDFVSDKPQLQMVLSQVPPEQVAICLVPASAAEAALPRIQRNIVYIKGPFLSSTLEEALVQANGLVADMKVSGVPSVHVADTLLSSPSPTSQPASGAISQPRDSADDIRSVTAPDADLAVLQSSAYETAAIERGKPIIPVFVAPTSSTKPEALLVDDNAINLRIMQMYCNKRGIPYHCATDGKQAVELYLKHQSTAATGGRSRIELILMDLQMPVCDGIEATRKIRSLEKQNSWPSSVLFIVTGQDSPSDRTDAEDAGADNYFVKPVGIKLLDEGVRRHFPAFEPS
ncbi:uncharacterized protein JN550_005236 [Neoarthrinium moseri]|uniref:uncharacterized protein n=1 Tax=Neoarthrinium moseri TaxID=1658444 RepID=UPI001FDCD814|nr:uncharacterized protein JN550_005236 [Neoarthrinium moseri]KAI1870308.1 hypothetical protein JN550_005236 [Neoarthrinium moseri]